MNTSMLGFKNFNESTFKTLKFSMDQGMTNTLLLDGVYYQQYGKIIFLINENCLLYLAHLNKDNNIEKIVFDFKSDPYFSEWSSN